MSLFFVFGLCFLSIAQDNNIQKLKDLLINASAQSREQVNLLNQLSEVVRSADAKASHEYAKQALQVATQINYQEGIADAYTNLGTWQGLIEKNVVKAYEFHEKAYRIYVQLYEQKTIDKWQMYEFITNHANPVYKFVVEKEGKKSKKDKKAMQNYQKLNAEMTEYLTALAADTRQQLDKASNALSQTSSALSETASKLSETNTQLKEKSLTEKTLIRDKNALVGSLYAKEKQANALAKQADALTDSIIMQQLVLQERELKLQMQALKLSQEKAKADKLAQEKALQDEQARNQRLFSIAAGAISILAFSFLVFAFINLRKQKKANNLLKIKNEEINQQKEEIESQRDNLEQLNAELSQSKEEVLAQNENLQVLNEQLKIEQDQSDRLLRNILPEEVAKELKATGRAEPKYYDMVTVIFTDFKGFTQHAERMHPEQIIQELNECFLRFDEVIEMHGLEKIKTIGDAYMCAGGIPKSNTTNPVDAVKAALAMQAIMQELNDKKRLGNEPIWELRLGIHTGAVVAGVVGKSKFAYDLWGDAVNLASRMESSGEVGKVNISGATYQYVKDLFECQYRGQISAKNKGEVDMYFVLGAKE